MPSSAAFTRKQTYAARAALPSTPPLADYLLRLMELKQSNICLAVDDHDGITTAELATIADECGDSIVVLKLHSDAVWDMSRETVDALTEISTRKRFLLFDDRLFGSHSPSLIAQYAATPLHPGAWTSLTSAHILHGDKVVKSLRAAAVSLLSRLHTQERNASRQKASDAVAADYFGPDSQIRYQRQQADATDSFSPGSQGDANSPNDPSPSSERKASSSSRTTQSPQAYSSRNISFADDNRARPHRPSPSITSTRSDPFDRRKSSVVSISTTISSSTEYIGSPPPQNSSSFGPTLARHPPTGISTSASSPGLTPDTDISDIASTTADATATSSSTAAAAGDTDFAAGPPLSRGILLNTDLDDSVFGAPGLSTTAEAVDGPNYAWSYKRGCVRVARVHREFVLGFVSDGASATSPARQDAGESFVSFVSGTCLPGDEGSGSIEAEKRRSRRKGGLGGDGYSDSSSASSDQADEEDSSDEDEEASSDSDDDDDDDDEEEDGASPRRPALKHAAAAQAAHTCTSPAVLVSQQGADVLIVGAPVMRALDRRVAVERYRRAGWTAYEQSLRPPAGAAAAQPAA